MKIKSAIIPLVFSAILVTSCVLVQNREGSGTPEGGYVPDAETAKRLAEAVWVPIYGVEEINSQKPFQVRFAKGVWVVQGVLHGQNTNDIVFGGTALAEIAQKDGRILKVSHGE